MATIFISYSRTDKALVRKLEPMIHNIYGASSLWYDTALQGGVDWWSEIKNEIQNCQVFLFLISDASIKSQYCQDELQEAIEANKNILPVLTKKYTNSYPEGIPFKFHTFLKSTQFIDIRGNESLSLSRLWGAINRVILQRSLTNVDRLLLYNQFEILRLLALKSKYPGNAEEYEEKREIIASGYHWHYQDIFRHIREPMPYQDSEEVIQILEMYRAIENFRIKNPEIDISSPYLKYRGFDGNYEIEQFSHAYFVIKTQGKFSESKHLNSHWPMLPIYRRMLGAWNKSANPFELTPQDIMRIEEASTEL
jgi:uncharacterized protein YfbU (UPF0304 family)